MIPGLGRSPGEGNGYPLQYSGLENSMDCIVHGGHKESDATEPFTRPQGISVNVKSTDTSEGLRAMPGCGENSVSTDHYCSSHERGPKGLGRPASRAGPPETYSDSLLGPREPLQTGPGALQPARPAAHGEGSLCRSSATRAHVLRGGSTEPCAFGSTGFPVTDRWWDGPFISISRVSVL